MHTITSTAVDVKSVASVTAAGISPDDVLTVVVTRMSPQRTFVDIYIKCHEALWHAYLA